MQKPVSLADSCSVIAGAISACNEVMPGGDVYFPGFSCTWNFMWRGSDGARYMGTAGHCTVDVPLGSAATSYQDTRLGTLVYKRFDPYSFDTKYHDDFALVRLDPGVPATGSVRVWGGPTGIYKGLSNQPVWLRHVGIGIGLGQAVPARRAVATAITSPYWVYFTGAINFDDSGSPVLTEDGRAVGWITLLINYTGAPGDVIRGDATHGLEVGTMSLTRLQRQVDFAQAALRLKLRLVTAPNQVAPMS